MLLIVYHVALLDFGRVVAVRTIAERPKIFMEILLIEHVNLVVIIIVLHVLQQQFV